MIEDRLRELRVEEPRLVLDLDALVDTADATGRRRRSILATTAAVLLAATAAMVVGGPRDARLPAAGISPAVELTGSTTEPTRPTAEDTRPTGPAVDVGIDTGTDADGACVDRYAAVWPKVVGTHLRKTRLTPVRTDDACPVYRVVDSGELLRLGVWRPAGPTTRPLLSDELVPGGGRVRVYGGSGERLVRWVGPDGTVVQATTTGTISQDLLIAIVTDPVLRR